MFSTNQAFRVYGRTDSGGRSFLGIAIKLGSGPDEVVFRWAASKQTRSIPRKEWDAWILEPCPNFRQGLLSR